MINKCPICRRGFEENQPEQNNQPQNANNQQLLGGFNIQRVNQMHFYGLEDD